MGELSNAIIVETGRATAAFITLTQIISAALIAIVYLGFALTVSWKITAALIALAVLMFLSIARLYRTSSAAGRWVGPLNVELQVLVAEYLSGAKILKATASEERAIKRVHDAARALERANRIGTFLPSIITSVSSWPWSPWPRSWHSVSPIWTSRRCRSLL